MASSLHQELSAMLLEFKASHDRLMAYEIVLEQPHVLDERINRITVSFSFFHSFFLCIMFLRQMLLLVS